MPDGRYESVDRLLDDLLRVEEQVRRESSKFYRWSVRVALAIPMLILLGFCGYQIYRAATRYPFRDSQTATITIQQPFELASISPDGRYLVYISHEQSLFNIWVRDMETSKERKLLRPSRNGYLWPTISPDSRHIYVSSIKALGSGKLGNQLIRIGLETGEVEELLEGVDSPVSFSPDGLWITYVTEKKGENESGSFVMVADRNGREIRMINARTTPEFYTLDGPVWSPDGQTIAVTAGTTTGPLYYNVVGIDVKSGVERTLTSRQWGHVLGLEWMADSVGMIISAKIRGTVPNHHLHYLNTKTGEDQQITFDDHDYFGKPSLTRQKDDPAGRSARVVTIRRQIQTSFWFNSRENPDEFESYSTQILQDGYEGMGLLDDGKVLYSSRLEDDENIWMTDLKGQKWRMTNNRESNRDPVITPDGRSIIFSSSLSGNPRIHQIDIDGNNQRVLTAGRLDKEPEISPDGKWVVYSAESSRKRTIWRVPLAGGEAVQLTTLATESPTISPDGDWIACLYYEDKVPGKVAILPSEGGEPVRFLILPRPNYPRYNYFRWSPDGRSLDYISLQDNAANIWRQPLNGDPAYKLTNFTGSLISDFEWSDDGRQLYCVRCTTVFEVVWMDQ
jgi:Tol biopolymer transport system component